MEFPRRFDSAGVPAWNVLVGEPSIVAGGAGICQPLNAGFLDVVSGRGQHERIFSVVHGNPAVIFARLPIDKVSMYKRYVIHGFR
jgi:hypothetical protein